jgi:hypothetical protein
VRSNYLLRDRDVVKKARPTYPIIIAHSRVSAKSSNIILPQATKGRFTEAISISPLTEVGRRRSRLLVFRRDRRS